MLLEKDRRQQRHNGRGILKEKLSMEHASSLSLSLSLSECGVNWLYRCLFSKTLTSESCLSQQVHHGLGPGGGGGRAAALTVSPVLLQIQLGAASRGLIWALSAPSSRHPQTGLQLLHRHIWPTFPKRQELLLRRALCLPRLDH